MILNYLVDKSPDTNTNTNTNSPYVFGILEHLKTVSADTPSRYKPEGLAVELADAIIRILDFTAHKNWDIDSIIALKMRYNETRPHKHGKIF